MKAGRGLVTLGRILSENQGLSILLSAGTWNARADGEIGKDVNVDPISTQKAAGTMPAALHFRRHEVCTPHAAYGAPPFALCLLPSPPLPPSPALSRLLLSAFRLLLSSLLAFDFCLLTFDFIPHPSSFTHPS